MHGFHTVPSTFPLGMHATYRLNVSRTVRAVAQSFRALASGLRSPALGGYANSVLQNILYVSVSVCKNALRKRSTRKDECCRGGA